MPLVRVYHTCTDCQTEDFQDIEVGYGTFPFHIVIVLPADWAFKNDGKRAICGTCYKRDQEDKEYGSYRFGRIEQ